jgi:catechol 2,3-dioxygenase-like lactoylglutathione lyase family enzyme
LFDLGGGDTVHFWEYPQAEIFIDPTPGSPWVPGVMQHVAFRVPNQDALRSVQDRVRAAGVEVSDFREHGSVESIYFKDNNGISIEIARWKVDPTGRAPEYDNPLFFSDPDPLLAVREAIGEPA